MNDDEKDLRSNPEHYQNYGEREAVRWGENSADASGVTAAVRSLQEELGSDFVIRLIGIFLANAPRILDELRRAFQEKDPTSVQRVAHTLKSDSTTFGAAALADVCQQTESFAREGALERVGPLLVRIEQDYRLLEQELRTLKGVPA